MLSGWLIGSQNLWLRCTSVRGFDYQWANLKASHGDSYNSGPRSLDFCSSKQKPEDRRTYPNGKDPVRHLPQANHIILIPRCLWHPLKNDIMSCLWLGLHCLGIPCSRHPVTSLIFLLEILFTYSWETHREKQRHTGRGRDTDKEREAGSGQGKWCGIQSQDPRITPWAEGRWSNPEPPGVPTSVNWMIHMWHIITFSSSSSRALC